VRRHPDEAQQPRRPRPFDSLLRAIATELEAVKTEMRAEMRAELRRAQRPRRRKKMTRAEMNPFVMSKPSAPK
jgi:hypothetical protein